MAMRQHIMPAHLAPLAPLRLILFDLLLLHTHMPGPAHPPRLNRPTCETAPTLQPRLALRATPAVSTPSTSALTATRAVIFDLHPPSTDSPSALASSAFVQFPHPPDTLTQSLGLVGLIGLAAPPCLHDLLHPHHPLSTMLAISSPMSTCPFAPTAASLPLGTWA